MNVKLVAFGIAKEILTTSSLAFPMDSQPSIGDLKNALIEKYPAFEELRSLKFAVNEDYQEDSYSIQSTDEVVIIPPVSGG